MNLFFYVTILVALVTANADAQNRKRVFLNTKWQFTKIEVSANSESGIKILVTDFSDAAMVSGPCPKTLSVWADSVEKLLLLAPMVPANEELEFKSPEVNSFGRMYFGRTVSGKSVKNTLVVYVDYQIVPTTVTDSMARV